MTAPEYEKFLPAGIPRWQMPYWESLKAKDVRVQRCDSCGAFRYVPKELCHRCHSSAASWTGITGTGEVFTYTVVRRAPTPAYQVDAPYAVVHVLMTEGFRMIGTLVDYDPERVEIGMAVGVVYKDVTPEWTILQFRPA